MSEKVEFLVVLSKHEKDINVLKSLYNDCKAILDQHHCIPGGLTWLMWSCPPGLAQ